jgi:hypothetical protein
MTHGTAEDLCQHSNMELPDHSSVLADTDSCTEGLHGFILHTHTHTHTHIFVVIKMAMGTTMELSPLNTFN